MVQIGPPNELSIAFVLSLSSEKFSVETAVEEGAPPRPKGTKNGHVFSSAQSETLKTVGNSEIFKKIATILLNSPVRLKADLDSRRFTIKNIQCEPLLQVNRSLAPRRFVWGLQFSSLGILNIERGAPPYDRVFQSKRLGRLHP